MTEGCVVAAGCRSAGEALPVAAAVTNRTASRIAVPLTILERMYPSALRAEGLETGARCKAMRTLAASADEATAIGDSHAAAAVRPGSGNGASNIRRISAAATGRLNKYPCASAQPSAQTEGRRDVLTQARACRGKFFSSRKIPHVP